MTTVRGVLLALHLLAAFTWVGGMAFALLVLRPSLTVLDPPQRLAVHREVFRRFFRLLWHGIPLVLVTGWAMVGAVFGGFARVNWAVNTMHALALVMTAVFLYVVFVPWRAMKVAPSPQLAEQIRRFVVVNLVLGVFVLIVAGWA